MATATQTVHPSLSSALAAVPAGMKCTRRPVGGGGVAATRVFLAMLTGYLATGPTRLSVIVGRGIGIRIVRRPAPATILTGTLEAVDPGLRQITVSGEPVNMDSVYAVAVEVKV